MTTYHHDTRFNRLCRAARGWALCLFALISAPAFASFAATPTSWSTSYGYAASTAQQSCTLFAQATWDANGSGVLSGSSPSYTCTPMSGAAAGPTGLTVGSGGGSCPANSSFASGQCTCTAPFEENAAHNGCQAPACSAGPAGFHRGSVAGEKVNPFDTCMNDCVTSVIPRLDLGTAVMNGTPVQTYATFELYRKAEACDSNTSALPALPSAGTTQTPPTPEPECPEGQRRAYLANGTPTCQAIPEDRFCPVGYTYGTVNGKDTCISQGTSPPTSSSPTTTDKTPSTESKESSTTTTNGDGSTTKVTTTSNGKGGGTTTTTTTSADGKTVEVVTKKTGNDPEGKCDADSVGCMKTGKPGTEVPAKSDRTLTLGYGTGLTGFVDGCPADRIRQTAAGEVRLSFSSACDVAPMVKPLVLLAAAVIAGLIVIQTLRS